jgi:hypothetical protein
LAAGFTLEALHQTEFCFRDIGQDVWDKYLKENGSNAIVQGITIELRANFNRNFS